LSPTKIWARFLVLYYYDSIFVLTSEGTQIRAAFYGVTLGAAAFWIRFLVHKPAARICVTCPHHKKKGTIIRAITHNTHLRSPATIETLIIHLIHIYWTIYSILLVISYIHIAGRARTCNKTNKTKQSSGLIVTSSAELVTINPNSKTRDAFYRFIFKRDYPGD
jgi:hypothetical protein